MRPPMDGYEPTPISFPGQHAKPAACQHHKRATATGTSSKRTYAHNRHRLHCFIQFHISMCIIAHCSIYQQKDKLGPKGVGRLLEIRPQHPSDVICFVQGMG
uniref:Uncharacterized protein n=1 Tax=Anopheles merus TaxID=30066 RepID=A0A182V0U3_ANOME